MADASVADDDSGPTEGHLVLPLGLSEQFRALSARSRATVMYVAAMLCAQAVILLGDWQLYLGCVVAHAAIIVPLYLWWRKHCRSCPLDMVIQSFGLGYRDMAFRVGPALLFMMLGIVMILIVAILTSLWVPMDPDSATLLVFENLILYTIQIGICVYMVGIVELFRVKMARQLKSNIDMSRETASDQLAYTVTSLGYATAVSVLIFDPFLALKAGAQHAHGGGDVPFSRSMILDVVHLVVVVLAMPVHALAGHLAGLNAARRLPFSKVGLEAFALRSALAVLGILWVKRLPFRSALMAWGLTYIATVALMMWCIKRAEAQLPQEYLQRVGLLHAFGYGVLPAHDPDQDDPNQVETASSVRQPV